MNNSEFEPMNVIKKFESDDFEVEQYDIMYCEDDDESPAVHTGCRVRNSIVGIDMRVHAMRDFADNEALALAAHNTLLNYIKDEVLGKDSPAKQNN